MSNASRPNEPPPPDVVGGFRVVRRIGSGGMGSVFEGEEPNIQRKVAIKILRARLADDPDFVERFRNEARLANAVQHPAIVDVFSFGRLDDGRPFFVMPLLEGESVRELLDRERRLSASRCWTIARQVASALAAAHGAGLIHRDLKPDNVFLERKGEHERVRVMDFGIAKSVAPGDSASPKTQTGILLGTPAYMAPEQWWGAKLDARVDQYALGVMLFEMLSGEPPFDPNHESGVMKLHLHQAPPKLGSRGVELPTEVDAFVIRLLAKEPSERFASMSEVIAAGDAVLGGEAPDGAAPNASDVASAATEVAPALAVPARTAPEAAKATSAEPAARSPLLRRWLVIHVISAVAALASLGAVGYAGSRRHDPVEWFRISGWSAYPVFASFVLAAALMPVLVLARDGARRFRGLTLGLALAPGLLGAFGTYMGWETVTRALVGIDATQGFELFNEGSYEAGANRFMGFGMSVGLALSLAALPGSHSHDEPAPRLGQLGAIELALAAALCVLAAVAFVLGAPSAVLVAVPAALFLWVTRLLPIALGDASAQVERSVCAAFALFFACETALERVAARQSVLWARDLTRAARIQEILAADTERAATLTVILFVCVITLGVQGMRLREVADLFGHLRRHLLLGVLLIGVATLDLSLSAKFRAVGSAAREALASQFALFAALDPPSAEESPKQALTPSRGAALQVSRTLVAVDGREITRLNAADTPEGRKRLQDALFDALARASNAPLSCLVDRSVTWAELRQLLALAKLAGATEAELLFTRGPPPVIPPRGPAEVGWVQPKDFVAVRVTLGTDGIELEGGKRFGELATDLLGSARSGKQLSLHIPGPPGRDPGH